MKKLPATSFCTLDSAEACAILKVSRDTLYAYVSRGMIRTIAHPDDARRSLYDRRDIATLVGRKSRGRSRRSVAESTINWGEPVLRSDITRIADGRFYYRGQDAVLLSRTASLEDILKLIANVGNPQPFSGFNDLPRLDCVFPLQRILRCMSIIATSGRPGQPEQDKPEPHWPEPNRPESNREAGSLLLAATQAVTQSEFDETANTGTQKIHERLALAWSSDRQAPDLIRRALVLCADHELNASTYATRVAASAGASLPACLVVGLATLSGSLHGGMTPECKSWIQSIKTSWNEGRPLAIQTTPPPGFGHALYPEGDPRATELFIACGSPHEWRQVLDQVRRRTGAHPTLDFGLSLVEDRLKLPEGAGLGIFAIGRMVGWIAHIFEQRRTGRLIRPRAST